MSNAHYLVPTGPTPDPISVRLGAGTGSSNNLSPTDEGKLVKLTAESTYDLCAAGDAIEGVITAIDLATSGGWTIGSVVPKEKGGLIFARADGLQATAGTGTLAVGDYVVAGTITAKGTALTDYPKVCKATAQPGAVPADLTAAGAAIKASLFAWRVVSLGRAGTGAVGSTIVLAPVV
jgi:hypothetical protein